MIKGIEQNTCFFADKHWPRFKITAIRDNLLNIWKHGVVNLNALDSRVNDNGLDVWKLLHYVLLANLMLLAFLFFLSLFFLYIQYAIFSSIRKTRYVPGLDWLDSERCCFSFFLIAAFLLHLKDVGSCCLHSVFLCCF